jgi:hypothetical protein
MKRSKEIAEALFIAILYYKNKISINSDFNTSTSRLLNCILSCNNLFRCIHNELHRNELETYIDCIITYLPLQISMRWVHAARTIFFRASSHNNVFSASCLIHAPLGCLANASSIKEPFYTTHEQLFTSYSA